VYGSNFKSYQNIQIKPYGGNNKVKASHERPASDNGVFAGSNWMILLTGSHSSGLELCSSLLLLSLP
jgi:hypothetical protein